MRFSLYETTKQQQPARQVSLQEAYDIVRTGQYHTADDIKRHIEQLRGEQDKAKRKQLKGELPIFVFSGEFEAERKEKANYNYSQLMCVDIDNLEHERVGQLFDQFKAWGYVSLMFVSPSGNGLKIVFSVNTNESQHKQVYKALLLTIRDKFNLPLKGKDHPDGLDTSCQDISRACYMSYDRSAFYDDVEPEVNAQQLLAKYADELQPLAKVVTRPSTPVSNDPIDVVEHIVTELERQHINISTSHQENIAIAWSLLSIGADVEHFHRITKLNPDYDFKKMDDRYKNLAKRENKYTLGTLIFMATKAGVAMPDANLLDDVTYVENWLSSKYEFRTNTISGKVEYRATAHDDRENTARWQPLDDFKLNEWSIALKKVKVKYTVEDKTKSRRLRVHKSELVDLIHNHVFSAAVNPVISFFERLHGQYAFRGEDTLYEVKKWFGAFDYGNREYAEAFWLDWFSGVIKNLTTEGYYDKIMVLSGVGGAGKTFAIKERLCKPFDEYFTQSFNWSSNKDDLSKITKYLFILDDELNTSRKADVEQIKNITSMSHTDIREAYARYDSRRARIANFIATTNNREFLTDLTGNRRFLVLDVESGNRDLVNSIDYNKLWAEVWEHFYIQKNTSSLSNETINENNNSFRQISVEEEALEECFDFSNVRDGRTVNENFVASTAKEIIDHVNAATGRSLPEDARVTNRIKAILNSKGLVQSKNVRYKGKQGRWWYLKVKKRDIASEFVQSTHGGIDFFSEN